MKKDDGFVNDIIGFTKFRLVGDEIYIHWKSDGSLYRTEHAWFREKSWAAEVKRLRAQVNRLNLKIRRIRGLNAVD